jgi:hypothetical protein
MRTAFKVYPSLVRKLLENACQQKATFLTALSVQK